MMARGNLKDMPHVKWFKLLKGWESLTPPVCLSIHMFCLPNKQFVSQLFISMWKFISTQLMGQGFVTGHSLVPGGLVARIQHCHCHRPQALAGDRNPASIITGGGHLRSGWQSKTAKLGFGPLLSSLYSGFSDLTIWVWSRSCFL